MGYAFQVGLYQILMSARTKVQPLYHRSRRRPAARPDQYGSRL